MRLNADFCTLDFLVLYMYNVFVSNKSVINYMYFWFLEKKGNTSKSVNHITPNCERNLSFEEVFIHLNLRTYK